MYTSHRNGLKILFKKRGCANMLYKYYLPKISNGNPMKDCGIAENSGGVSYFITTNQNLESVKKALRERFIEKHEMSEFSQPVGITYFKNDKNHPYTFEKAAESIDKLKLEKEIKEKIYKVEEGKEVPEYWIGVFVSGENALLYMPNGEYFEYEDDWSKFKEAAEDLLSITVDTTKRPIKSSCPRRCPYMDQHRILDDDLKPMDKYKYCDDSTYKLLNGIK